MDDLFKFYLVYSPGLEAKDATMNWKPFLPHLVSRWNSWICSSQSWASLLCFCYLGSKAINTLLLSSLSPSITSLPAPGPGAVEPHHAVWGCLHPPWESALNRHRVLLQLLQPPAPRDLRELRREAAQRGCSDNNKISQVVILLSLEYT